MSTKPGWRLFSTGKYHYFRKGLVSECMEALCCTIPLYLSGIVGTREPVDYDMGHGQCKTCLQVLEAEARKLEKEEK